MSNPTDLPPISTKTPLLEVPSSNPITWSPRSVCLWNDIQGKAWHVITSAFRVDLWSGVRVENRLCSVGMDTSSFSPSQAEPPGFLKFIYHSQYSWEQAEGNSAFHKLSSPTAAFRGGSSCCPDQDLLLHKSLNQTSPVSFPLGQKVEEFS